MKTFLKILVGVLLAAGLFAFASYRTPQERAFKKHLKSAQEGKLVAQLSVAQDYLTGKGTQPDLAQAVFWYKKAAASGSPEGAWELYDLYTSGKYAPAEGEDPFDYLQAAVEGKLPAAQYEMGNLYTQGKHVQKHAGQALFWYLTSARNGFAAAQAKANALATEDADLFNRVNEFLEQTQSARQDPQAMLFVARAYQSGDPILQDHALANQWFTQAWNTSDHTLPAAALALWEQYREGQGVEKDENKALEFLAQAAELKDPVAQYQLGEQAYSEQPARLEDAFAWFSNAAAQGHSQAQYMTGFMLLQGQGTAKSVPLALRFFEQAAEQENPSAQYVLGQIYLKGLGVKKSPRKGRAWLARAAQNGSAEAQTLLGQ